MKDVVSGNSPVLGQSSLWSGLHWIDALIEGTPLQGVWHDRTAEYEAGRCNKTVDDPRAFLAEYSLELEPLPCWRHLPAEEYRRRIAEMVDDIEVETARRIFLTGKVPMGPEAIRRQNPLDQAVRPKKSPAPFVLPRDLQRGQEAAARGLPDLRRCLPPGVR